MSKLKLWVRWITSDPASIDKIRQRFNMPCYTTINGFTPCEIDESDMGLLEETAQRGFLSIMPIKWRQNGDCFSFISR